MINQKEEMHCQLVEMIETRSCTVDSVGSAGSEISCYYMFCYSHCGLAQEMPIVEGQNDCVLARG